jgi:dihydroflavonol-4-reductase
MKALVTGAAGLVGANLARVLLADGAQEVRALVRPTSDLRGLRGLDVEIVHGDVRDAEAVTRAVAGCATVYHCAAVYQLVGGDDAVIVDTAVRGARNVLEAIGRAAGVERVVLTSSVVAVGRARSEDAPCDESSPWNVVEPYAYMVAKRRAEEAALALAAERALPLVVVNPSGVLGRHDWKPTPSATSVLTLLNAPLPLPFYPEGGTNLVDAEDVARGHLLAARRGRVGERYILAGENALYRDILATVAEIAGLWRPRFALGPRLAFGVGAAMEAAARLTGMTPDLTRALAKQHVGIFQYYSARKAEGELGWTARPMRAVLERAVRWLAANGFVRRAERLRLAPAGAADAG